MEAQLRRTALVSVAAVVGTGLAVGPASAERRPEYGGAIVGSLLSEPVSLDPVKARSHAEITLIGLVFDTLYRLDASGAPVPHLAVGDPDVSHDGREAHVRLRPGVEFHDGRALTAADVARSLERARASGADWALAPVSGVRVESDEVIIELSRATPELTALLAAPQTAITPGGRAPRDARPIGTGPYRLTRLARRRRHVVLRPFDEHFAGRPYLDRVELRWYRRDDAEARAYEAGRTHMSLRGAVAFAGHQPKWATEKVEGPATALVHVGFGRAHRAVTGDRDLRQALSLALGRDGLRGIGSGERVVPALDPVPLDLGGPVPSDTERRPRLIAARAALDKAARSVPLLDDIVRDGRSVDFEVIVDRTRPDDREIAEKVVDALFRLGLEANISELDPEVFARRVRRGRCDFYIGQLAVPGSLPALTYAAAFALGGDDWATEKLERAPLGARIGRRAFRRRLPIVPLVHRAVRASHRSDLFGVGFDALGRITIADLFVHGRPRRAGRGR